VRADTADPAGRTVDPEPPDPSLPKGETGEALSTSGVSDRRGSGSRWGDRVGEQGKAASTRNGGPEVEKKDVAEGLVCPSVRKIGLRIPECCAGGPDRISYPLPEVLARLKVGQEIDRDPFTGFTMRVGHVDGQLVGLLTEGPRQSFGYYFDRQQGFLVRRVTHDRQANVPGMVMVNDVQLAAWR